MNLLPIEWSIKSRSLSLLVRGGGMSGDKVCATIDNDSIKAKKKSNHSLTTCSQWQRHVQLRVFLKKKIFNLYQEYPQSQNQEYIQIKKKKKFELKFEKKKKIVTKPSPWQAQQITEVANPQILKKNK